MPNGAMPLNHIVVAADESAEGRTALVTALALARRARARLTVMTVVPAVDEAGGGSTPNPPAHKERELARAVAELTRWVRPQVVDVPEETRLELGAAYGVPSIEICRFAEDRQADLLLLGRKHRSPSARLLVGDTADAVARRSRVPCLFVPQGFTGPTRVLAALDGTPRGFAVLVVASGLARRLDVPVDAAVVEPAAEDALIGQAALAVRAVAPSGARMERVRALLGIAGAPAVATMHVRSGEIVAGVLDAARASAADVLAVGYHRGGLPGVVDGGSTGRRLVHGAPGAVLTVPL